MRKKKFVLNDLDEKTKKELEEGSKKVNMVDVMEDQSHAKMYIPGYNRITGGTLSTILLLQAVYWWGKSGKEKFYKFRDKCKHPLYAEGDSWCEELGWTGAEFDGAIKEIGFKLGKTQNRIKEEEAFIVYYKDPQGVTWYDIRDEYLDKSITFNYLLIRKSLITNESGKVKLHNTNTNTKSSTSNTTNQKPVVKGEKEGIFKPVKFDYRTEKWDSFTKEYKDGLKTRYPRLDLKTEFRKLTDWLIDEKENRKVKNFRLFITNWLLKAEKNMDEGDNGDRYQKTEEEFAPDSHVNFSEVMKKKKGDIYRVDNLAAVRSS